MELIDHANILRFEELFETDNVVIIVMKLMATDLRNALKLSDNQYGMSELKAKGIFM